MRDRRARILLVVLILSLPFLIEAMAARRVRPAAGPTPVAGPGRPVAASVAPRVVVAVEAVEAVLVAGLTFAGWQRRRLPCTRPLTVLDGPRAGGAGMPPARPARR